MCVQTRVQKQLIDKVYEVVEGKSPSRIDHPGVVEILKRPINSIGLSIIFKSEFNTIANKYRKSYKQGYLIYICRKTAYNLLTSGYSISASFTSIIERPY